MPLTDINKSARQAGATSERLRLSSIFHRFRNEMPYWR